jgi:tyrosine decarboxylase/aspartate 1-decarboxylase
LQAKGSNKRKVLAELKRIHDQDQRYEDGKILGSMCTLPHQIAQEAYGMFLSSNLGDGGLFHGSQQIENEVVKQLASILHGKDCCGFIVSGGTEANLMALLAAKNLANVDKPEVVLPESAHFSFTKICKLLNLKPVNTSLDSSFRVDASSVERCVNENTVAIVGTAGTAELGVVDPIEELSRIAFRHEVCLHVDAAFGGLVIPFLDSPPLFDFGLPAMKSMTVDPHKMGMAAIPSGGIIFRDRKSLDFIRTETPYLSDHFQYTFVGTRTGASVASAWAVFRYLGVAGFKKIVGNCIMNTCTLARELKNAGFSLVVEPTLNILAFRNGKDSKRLAEKLWKNGWFVSYVPRYDCIRIVLMPHVKSQHITAFIQELTGREKL